MKKTKETYNRNYNTIYDDVFRTILEKMPWMMIPVINEVFHTTYSEDARVIVLHNEHHRGDGEVVTDACLLIERHMYHIECQSWPDSCMEIRMIEYDFFIALEHARKVDGTYVMELPRSCTLYLRHTKNTPNFLKVLLLIPDARNISEMQKVTYEVPVVKVQCYTKEEIFKKKLIAFLPYYIMRYEKQLKTINDDTEKLQKLLQEYESIREQLDEELQGADKAAIYTDLVNLIIRISDYFLESSHNIKKGVAEIMGGKVLELESERLLAKGHAEGLIKGHAEGEERMAKLVNCLVADDKVAEISKVTSDKELREKYYVLYKI